MGYNALFWPRVSALYYNVCNQGLRTQCSKRYCAFGTLDYPAGADWPPPQFEERHMTMTITVRYAAVDGYRVSRKFTSIAGARKFAARYIGNNPDTFGGSYAVSDDGVGTVRVEGCTLAKLFGQAEPRTEKREPGRFSLILGDAAYAFGGPAYEINTEDGPQAVCDWFCGLTVAGLHFAHGHRFTSRYDAQAFADKVNARGTTNPALWTKIEPYDREAEAEADWQDEQEDRRAWGA